MSWTLYRWTWLVRAPLYLGIPPAGSLNRTRLFVPARTLWGALTAELARHEAEIDLPDYNGVGRALREDACIGYLFPAESVDGKWMAWLPTYESGLRWTREDGRQSWSDRMFRRRILGARPGTAIGPTTDTVTDGSLRETECIQTKWRVLDSPRESAVAMTGYVFLGGDEVRSRLDAIQQVFVGGDTRYGLGLIERSGRLVEADHFFGDSIALDEESPRIHAAVVRSHSRTVCGEDLLRGRRERVSGWNMGQIEVDLTTPLWCPGSTCSSDLWWSIDESGFWKNVTS